MVRHSERILFLISSAERDHGIEKPSVREEIGKSAQGCLHVQLKPVNDYLEIRFWDDGAGLDLQAIKKKAVAKNFISEQDNRLEEIVKLICKAGFSTAQAVSEISGRGVGLDAIKVLAEDHGGIFRIELIENIRSVEQIAKVAFIIEIPNSMFTLETLQYRKAAA